MSKKTPIEENLNCVDVSAEVGAISGSRTPTVIAWYKTAKKNLRSAKILFENKQYPHSIFFIQQCVECLVKGTFLESGIISEEKVRDISHHPSKAFRDLYTKINSGQGLYYCNEFQKRLDAVNTFEEKLKVSAKIANQFTTQYTEDTEDIKNALSSTHFSKYENMKALGLSADASQLACHLVALQNLYTQNILLLLSYTFTHDIEQSARYFSWDNNIIIMPDTIYSTPTVIDSIETLLNLLESNIRDIVGATNID